MINFDKILYIEKYKLNDKYYAKIFLNGGRFVEAVYDEEEDRDNDLETLD
jgi:hypothetical protein